jgi:hypothetical protein
MTSLLQPCGSENVRAALKPAHGRTATVDDGSHGGWRFTSQDAGRQGQPNAMLRAVGWMPIPPQTLSPTRSSLRFEVADVIVKFTTPHASGSWRSPHVVSSTCIADASPNASGIGVF